jgi:hypothetical protein
MRSSTTCTSRSCRRSWPRRAGASTTSSSATPSRTTAAWCPPCWTCTPTPSSSAPRCAAGACWRPAEQQQRQQRQQQRQQLQQRWCWCQCWSQSKHSAFPGPARRPMRALVPASAAHANAAAAAPPHCSSHHHTPHTTTAGVPGLPEEPVPPALQGAAGQGRRQDRPGARPRGGVCHGAQPALARHHVQLRPRHRRHVHLRRVRCAGAPACLPLAAAAGRWDVAGQCEGSASAQSACPPARLPRPPPPAGSHYCTEDPFDSDVKAVLPHYR